MAASVVGLCKTVPIREKGPWRDLGRLEYGGPRVRRLVQPPTTKTSKAQCLALPTTAIATWNTTYLGAAVDHGLPTHQPPSSIRRHQHNHTTPRPTPAPNRRPNRRFLYRCWIYPYSGLDRCFVVSDPVAQSGAIGRGPSRASIWPNRRVRSVRRRGPGTTDR